jgi:hypothetical protein
MQAQLGNRWFKLVTITYVSLLVVSFFILSAPPGKLGIYITLVVLGVAACFLGKGFLRVLAFVLVLLALCLSMVECKRGQELHQKLHEIQNQGK